jgi:acyl-CoA reductase-like NAD-dependent aldehyde dehydrogenase
MGKLTTGGSEMLKSSGKLYIGGAWIDPVGSEKIDVINPSTEEILGQIPEGVAEDVNRAVLAARQALEAWSEFSLGKRITFLKKIRQSLEARQDEIAALISQEVGTPLKISQRIQAWLPSADIGSFVEMADGLFLEETLNNSTVYREPRGVVACITPWNYPLHQIVSKIAPALIAGCTVVLKPSEAAPFNAFVLAEIIDSAGLPPGVFNLVTGYGATVGEALVSHPEIDMISFTGSTSSGKRVAALAAQDVKRLALELGGKSASIILDDADLEKAVKGTLNSCFLNSGQTCNALTRMLVPEDRYDEISRKVVEMAETFTVGDPLDPLTKLGPLISSVQQERARSLIMSGIEEGAELLTGGAEAPAEQSKGYFVKPTVFGKVTTQMKIAQQEIFGPVLSIMTYKTDDEAIQIANDTVYGLAGAVWSVDAARANRIARKLKAGQIDINGARFNLNAPFGGFKQSGLGRELGRYGIDEFFELKSIQN